MVNLMKFKTLMTVTLLCLGQLAFGQGQVISQAYELVLSDFRAPATANGGITFQECDECERMNVRVTEGTRYTISGKAVLLKDFRKAIANVRNRDGVAVTVLHHLESDTIEMINVSL
jgi:hypothetical protein